MRRFQVYEAAASYQNEVPVATYVLFSGTIRNPMTELREGVNDYRIVPIIMRDDDADQVIVELRRKVELGERLSRKELVPLALCMLMDGKMPQKERAKAAFKVW